MDDEEGGGPRLSKRFSDKGGEVDYKTKAGTAWSHSYLNQKPWHPLSYPNQRRKWIAEQTDAQKQRRAEEVSREVNSVFSCFNVLLWAMFWKFLGAFLFFFSFLLLFDAFNATLSV